MQIAYMQLAYVLFMRLLHVCIVHTFCTQSMAYYSMQLKRRLHICNLHMFYICACSMHMNSTHAISELTYVRSLTGFHTGHFAGGGGGREACA